MPADRLGEAARGSPQRCARARPFALGGLEVKRRLRAGGSAAPTVALAQIGICAFDGQIGLEALRLYGLPKAAPALLCGTPTLPVGRGSSRRRSPGIFRRWRLALPACST
jgi:hypothetical protein